jgi:hypothetical protein
MEDCLHVSWQRVCMFFSDESEGNIEHLAELMISKLLRRT